MCCGMATGCVNPTTESSVRSVEAAVVEVDCAQAGQVIKSFGTMFRVTPNVVLGAYHPVADCVPEYPQGVTVAGKWATVVNTIPSKDLVYLSSMGRAVARVRTEPLRVGEPVTMVGTPQDSGFLEVRGRVLRTGMVLNEGKERIVRGTAEVSGVCVPGMSGGPVVDSSGRVAGVILAVTNHSTWVMPV